jgi:aspartyl-tRNA(Asn)/glutamyl-tRNA(Gln) amidotransferase subunit C
MLSAVFNGDHNKELYKYTVHLNLRASQGRFRFVSRGVLCGPGFLGTLLFVVNSFMLSNEEILHIAALARLGLKEGEAERFSRQLNDILRYVEQLKEVDTSDVESTSQVTGLENVSRKDEVERVCEKKELLDCSELPVVRDQIRVKPVITEL